MAPPMQPAPTLGKYRLLAELGQGGMAKVYLALVKGPAGFNKLVVLKEIRAQLAEDPDVVTMFLDEARLAARLNHPNVVQTNEVGEEEGHYFIAMEYLEGQTYNRIFNRLKGKLSLPMQLRAVAETLRGLHYAHELKDFDGTPLGVVHRDVSPHNVFVTYSGQVKVVDFGIAKALTSANETRTGILKGKAAYMAPEQAAGDRVDRRADIYAVGVMLWEIAAGRRMWKGIPEVGILTKLITGEVPAAKDADPNLPPRLAAIIDRALARRREDRYETAAELQADLEAFADTTGDKAGVRELGGHVSEEFAADRAKVQAIVEEQMRAPPASSLPLLEAPLTSVTGVSGPDIASASGLSFGTPSPTRREVGLPAGGPLVEGPRTRTSTDVSMQQPALLPQKPSSGKRMAIAIAAVVLAGAVATVVGLQVIGQRNAQGDVATTASAVSAKHTLRIESEPPGATIRDGERVLGSTPLAMDVAPNDPPKELVAWMDGYEPYVVKVPSLTSDLAVRADLVKKSAAPEPSGEPDVGATEPEPTASPKKLPVRGPGPKKPPAKDPPPPPPPNTGDIRLQR